MLSDSINLEDDSNSFGNKKTVIKNKRAELIEKFMSLGLKVIRPGTGNQITISVVQSNIKHVSSQ